MSARWNPYEVFLAGRWWSTNEEAPQEREERWTGATNWKNHHKRILLYMPTAVRQRIWPHIAGWPIVSRTTSDYYRSVVTALVAITPDQPEWELVTLEIHPWIYATGEAFEILVDAIAGQVEGPVNGRTK